MTTKKFYFDETKPPIIYRPGTSDEYILQSVMIDRREYKFPQFKPKIVYDVGANIGIVSVILAMIYPESKIFAFEPVKANFDLLRENVSHYENVMPIHAALGNDGYDHTGRRIIYPSEDPTNQGGFSTAIKSGMGFEISVIDTGQAISQYGIPELIKIDCEGAEHEILTNMPLRDVKWIAGELHGIYDFKLLEYLRDKAGFEIEAALGFGQKCWHFHARARDFGLDQSPQK